MKQKKKKWHKEGGERGGGNCSRSKKKKGVIEGGEGNGLREVEKKALHLGLKGGDKKKGPSKNRGNDTKRGEWAESRGKWGRRSVLGEARRMQDQEFYPYIVI